MILKWRKCCDEIIFELKGDWGIKRDKRAKNARRVVAKQQETLHRSGRSFKILETIAFIEPHDISVYELPCLHISFGDTSVSVEKHSSTCSTCIWGERRKNYKNITFLLEWTKITDGENSIESRYISSLYRMSISVVPSLNSLVVIIV